MQYQAMQANMGVGMTEFEQNQLAMMQAMGGMGYAKEMHIERLWRDARLFRFAPISEEMILNFIAMHDLGMARGY